MSDLTAIDADGHIIEKENDIRKCLRSRGIGVQRRCGLAISHGTIICSTPFNRNESGASSPCEQVARCLELMDEHGIETAVCFPTGSGSIVRLQEVPFQIAVARACND
jgi:hypothetical protein